MAPPTPTPTPTPIAVLLLEDPLFSAFAGVVDVELDEEVGEAVDEAAEEDEEEPESFSSGAIQNSLLTKPPVARSS